MNPVTERLGYRVRVRVGGLLFDNPEQPEALLLVKHRGLFDDVPFWTPPGGEVRFGESLTEALVREVREETGLLIQPGPLTYTLDFIRYPLHAVSFYFRIASWEGQLHTGSDPEFSWQEQLIRETRFVPLERLSELRLAPEGLDRELQRDVERGFPACARYLGTFR